MPAPVFLLAFAYDQTQALPEVVNELRTIQRLLSQTGGNAEPIWQATPDDLEDRIIGKPEQGILETIFRLKRDLTRLRRFAAPLREVAIHQPVE